MAPKYKLTYFNATALGECIRLLLHYGEIDFEDNRFEMEQWPAIKPSMPFGQVPVLEYDGKVEHQSVAIARYIAKQVKLVGSNDWEDLEIDATVDTVHELRQKIALYNYEPNTAAKEEKRKQLFDEILPHYLERLDAQAKKNNRYLACGKLTWADLFFVGVLDYMKYMLQKDILENYPNLQGVKEKVLTLPSIKAWVEKRPKTFC